MNRERAKELLPIIQAFAEGEEIEWRRNTDDSWLPSSGPIWESGNDYRVKPKPRKVWLNLYPGGSGMSYFSTKDLADKASGEHRIACLEVELPSEP